MFKVYQKFCQKHKPNTEQDIIDQETENETDVIENLIIRLFEHDLSENDPFYIECEASQTPAN